MRQQKINSNQNKPKDENAIILDIIEDNSNSFRKNNTIQALGTKTYSILELIAKDGVELSIGDTVYIGDGKREEIQFIKRALYPDKLTGTAKSELLFTIMDIIDERSEEYINFFNIAGPITIRKHAFELIPGVGKKHVADLIKIRETKKFESFKDISQRVPFLPEPQKSLANRILEEIEGKTEHNFFIIR